MSAPGLGYNSFKSWMNKLMPNFNGVANLENEFYKIALLDNDTLASIINAGPSVSLNLRSLAAVRRMQIREVMIFLDEKTFNERLIDFNKKIFKVLSDAAMDD